VRINRLNNASLTGERLSLQWPIYIVDFTDAPSVQVCKNVESTMGIEYVHYSQRSIVKGRFFDSHAGWIETGDVMKLVHRGKTYRHTPLIVRTDTVAALEKVLKQPTHYNDSALPLSQSIENLPRSVDVSHFWPIDGKSVGTIHANLRHKISSVIEAMGQENNITVFVGLAGNAARQGRRGVTDAYAEGLLNSKIVVVTQRDAWEDHYRLFEVLASGAMLITDRMLSLPAGLVNGTSVIEVVSADDLRSKILYYLDHNDERREIARQGRWVAMSRHRSWHRIEEIIFGFARTTCTEQNVDSRVNSSSACPFIVHASEKGGKRIRHRERLRRV
jgi:hypothetical protein